MLSKSHVARLPANTLVASIKQLETDLYAFKQRQRISGQSGVLGYTTDTGNTWDLIGTVGSDSDTSDQTTAIEVVWEGDNSQVIAFANVAYDVFVNGTDSAHQLTPMSPTWTDGTRTASIEYQALSINHWIYGAPFQLTTFKAATYYVKAHVVASCPGKSLTVTA